jgi:hypothetical protein
MTLKILAVAVTLFTAGTPDGGSVSTKVPGMAGKLIEARLADAGYADAAVPDAGTPPKTEGQLDDRRTELLMRVSTLKEGIEATYKVKVELSEILFASTRTANSDAAIVVFKIGPQKVPQGVFFFYGSGQWKVFPSDFSTNPF